MVENAGVEFLRDMVRSGGRDALVEALKALHPADAAEVLATLRPEEIARFIEILGPETALPIFEFVPFEVQKETLEYLPRNVLVQLISNMRPDERADLVEEMDEVTKDRLLALLIQAERQNLLKLLTYPEDSAGAYMTTDYALLRPETRVRSALDQLRLQAPKKETIYYAYVVDDARRLVGIVSLRDLIMARPENLVGDIMHTNVIAVRVDMDIEEVAKEMVRYDFLAMPVVDGDNRLVGIITYDDIFDVMTEEATEDMYFLANLDTDEKVSSPLRRSVVLRVPWLMVNLATALVVSYTVHVFSDTIQQFVVLASLMPIVAMLGGNAGNQSLTVVVRALALGEMQLKGNWRIVLKEAGVGFCNGLAVGLVMGGIAYLWHRNLWLATIICMAMTINLVVAGLFGAMVPITLRKLNLDPALGSSIFVTTATDVGGFCAFLGLASLFIHQLLSP